MPTRSFHRRERESRCIQLPSANKCKLKSRRNQVSEAVMENWNFQCCKNENVKIRNQNSIGNWCPNTFTLSVFSLISSVSLPLSATFTCKIMKPHSNIQLSYRMKSVSAFWLSSQQPELNRPYDVWMWMCNIKAFQFSHFADFHSFPLDAWMAACMLLPKRNNISRQQHALGAHTHTHLDMNFKRIFSNKLFRIWEWSIMDGKRREAKKLNKKKRKLLSWDLKISLLDAMLCRRIFESFQIRSNTMYTYSFSVAMNNWASSLTLLGCCRAFAEENCKIACKFYANNQLYHIHDYVWQSQLRRRRR